jgi:hypothetical protein
MTVKQIGIAALAALALFGGGYGLARYLTPNKVVTIDTTKEMEELKKLSQTLTEVVEQNKDFRTQISELKKSIHRETHTLQRPDGNVETTKVEDINVSQVVKEQEVKFVDREVKTTEIHYVDRVETKEVVKEKIVEGRKPDWALTALVGTSAPTKLDLTPPYLNPLVVGGVAERRILGPVFVGVWAITQVQNPANVSGGIAVKAEF